MDEKERVCIMKYDLIENQGVQWKSAFPGPVKHFNTDEYGKYCCEEFGYMVSENGFEENIVCCPYCTAKVIQMERKRFRFVEKQQPVWVLEEVANP